MTIPAYRDPSLPVERRVNDLVERMQLDEKLAQLGAIAFPRLMTKGGLDQERALSVVPHGIGQVTRIGATTGLEPAQSAELFNQVQRIMVERTRLGVPVMVHEESLAGYCARGATVFPQALALGCSWDPYLVSQVADRARRQLLAVGARHSLAPVLDVARDPRWGRLEETYGEDPVLVGVLGAAYVRAMQTDDLSQGVLATGKHFVAHAMSEGGRNRAPVQIGPRELREVYAEPFAAAIREAGLATVMSAYSSVDGLPGSGSVQLLTGLLRDELGFEGMVVADYFAVTLLMTYHRVAADRAEAAAKAITAGLDLELPALDCFNGPLKSAITAGKVPLAVVDTALRRVLSAKVKLGLFESPYVEVARVRGVFADPANAGLARRAAVRGIVMLTNKGVLPLPTGITKIAMIGPAADDRRLLQGDYHYPAHQELMFEQPAAPSHDGSAAPEPGEPGASASVDFPDTVFLPSGEGRFRPGEYYTDHITPLAGLRAALGPGAEVAYVKGCAISGDDRSGFANAVAAAAAAQVAVVVVGGRSGLQRDATVGEARDAVDLRLTGPQEDLVKSVAATGTPTVVVVMSGRAHVLSEVAGTAQALLVAWPLGEQGGNALADVLLGRAEPGGRLAVSLPRAAGQVPLYSSHRSGGSFSVFYNDYTDCDHKPLFSFGHGLGYTTFAYSDLVVEARGTSGLLTVAVTVTNTGERPGEEVVQLYASDLVASVARPEASLIGFTRVDLAAGEAARVTFDVHPSRLAFYNEDMQFVVEPGEFRFAVGASSSDIREEAVAELTGPVARYSQRTVVAVTSTVGYVGDRAPTRM
ncbi:MAG TPA: glycoside hydrolase family 3 N-terminal domain-containing protein [Acidimicrobiales bacterium]|nr:glycoside hydrolase family 3 N-terminal domain-containing protein [Acidimicrobiales bacterium]